MDLNKGEIVSALIEETELIPANSVEESAEELKSLGIRDISEANMQSIMDEAMKNVQIQRTLEDISRGSSDKRSIKTYIEHHISFLERVSSGKTKKDIIEKLTVEHVQAILKTTAKKDNVPEAIIKKHLKTLRKKFS